jgi:hypothetical protein
MLLVVVVLLVVSLIFCFCTDHGELKILLSFNTTQTALKTCPIVGGGIFSADHSEGRHMDSKVIHELTFIFSK